MCDCGIGWAFVSESSAPEVKNLSGFNDWACFPRVKASVAIGWEGTAYCISDVDTTRLSLNHVLGGRVTTGHFVDGQNRPFADR